MKNLIKQCPSGHGEMLEKKSNKSIEFRGIAITYQEENYTCPECEIEVSNSKQIAKTQKNMSDAYRSKVGLLSGSEIKQFRKKFNFSQEALAKKMTVGVASIKRWEGGIIQSKSMDNALRNVFWQKERDYNFTGNRELSIPRIKLVLSFCESILKEHLLCKRDKFLYAAKYLWYADMVAHRDLRKSMTGATYAALPYGPQLNNYKDLIDIIKKSNESDTEPLTSDENNILKRICKAFPEKRYAYDAAHRELIWKNKSIGEIIFYSDSSNLMEI